MPAATWAALVAALRRVNASADCQAVLNEAPCANVWIAKPSGKSRGRGIVCEKTLSRVLWRQGGEGGGSSLGKSAAGGGYIVQKYIERPLLVQARKFDVRQWVMVTSWAPLEVWMYRRCYARFCAWPFALGAVGNRFAHLSNNSVQKHSAAFGASGIEGNMWVGEALAAWVQARAGEGAWEGVTYAPLARGGRGAGFAWGGKAAAGEGEGGGGGGGGGAAAPPHLRLPRRVGRRGAAANPRDGGFRAHGGAGRHVRQPRRGQLLGAVWLRRHAGRGPARVAH